MRHQGPAIEAMRAVATAHQHRSLGDFEAALAAHAVHLRADSIISTHLNALYDMLLQENICRIIEPYSRVETAHIAALMKLPLRQIEEKLSQMILDKKFKVAPADVAILLTATLLFHTQLLFHAQLGFVVPCRLRHPTHSGARVHAACLGHPGCGSRMPHCLRGAEPRSHLRAGSGDARQHE